jgi:hypothetical protein
MARRLLHNIANKACNRRNLQHSCERGWIERGALPISMFRKQVPFASCMTGQRRARRRYDEAETQEWIIKLI